MTKAHTISEVVEQMPIAAFFYEILLLLYPAKYRSEYAAEMRQVFYDLYEEEKGKNGLVGLGFWIRVIWDITISTFEQHAELLTKIGWRKYWGEVWGINKFAAISLLLLTPFILLIITDFSTVLLFGNRNAMQVLYQSPIWIVPIAMIILIIFPAISILLNLYSLIIDPRKTVEKIRTNFFNYLFTLIGFSVFVLLFGHDLIPCIIKGIGSSGLIHLYEEVSYCSLNS